MDSLTKLLQAAACLSGTVRASDIKPRMPDVTSILLNRIHAAQTVLGDDDDWSDDSHIAIEQNTANFALHILERLQILLDVESGELHHSSLYAISI